MGARKSVSTAGTAVLASGAGDLLPQAQPGSSTVSSSYPLYSARLWLEAVLSWASGGLPVSVPFPAVPAGLGPALSPRWFPRACCAGPVPAGGRGKGAEGDLHRAEGTSGHRDALGGCRGEEMGPGTARHAALAAPAAKRL